MWPTSYVSPFPEWAQRQILTPHKICGPHYMWPTTCDAAAASVAVEMSGLPKLETSRDDNICMRTDKVIYLPQNMWPTSYVSPFPEWAQRQILTPHKICGPHYMWPTSCDAAAASVAVEMSGLPKLETSRD